MPKTNIPQGKKSYDPNTYKIKKFASALFELVKIIVIALAIVVPIRYFLIQPFYVKGQSMEPTFHSSEYLIINEITYRFNDPKRGDVIVFKYPRDPSQFFIKRVIGLPNESVKVENGLVYIKHNGDNEDWQLLDESDYLDPSVKTYPNVEMTMGEDEYFVLGDNRPQSLDSRAFHQIEEQYIIGKTWIRAWPMGQFDIFSSVKYDIDNN